ncbi:hypothetical protein HHL16_21495 [Pseudoflavitalea sp. G-6-1-2]|uniref:hypothetical protein n=1 Tax=Pseudoflavitalea sp. G-6-1-2 TaxID=2728841 RepID=UPI00146EAF54|nr:hypothetical protein [Pseudoflavitalea sp. G-6-1-2]NML23469.1 hypothetical protein [Pseudoflavitalea sp. G-6-1-2]
MKSKFTIEDAARYAEGLMSAEEQQEFETALTEDSELQQQLNLYKEVNGSLERSFTAAENEEQLRATLKDMRGEFFSNDASAATVSKPASAYKATVVKMMWRKVAITAAAAILIAVFVWQPWNKDPYSQYAVNEMESPVERGSHTDSVLVLASKAFNAKEYSSAATYLYEVVEKDSSNSFAQYYYGIALLQSGATEKARQTLITVSKGSSAFQHEASFYVALSYLKEKDTENCKKWLQQIPATSGNYGKAQELLQDL